MQRTVRADEPLFNLESFGRRGLARRDHLSPAAVEQIRRTVQRTPEVMVKVLSQGGQDLKAVRRHLDYLRHRDDGEREVETDDGEQLTGRGVSGKLLHEWNLDLEQPIRRSDLEGRGRRSSKLVHKLIFSMPAGTPPNKVLEAVRNFAREEFALQHRYAMVLHTEAHPHVHVVVKAMSEQGVRLHIRKATLRHWRGEFARHLRVLGVAANATRRAVRGESRASMWDGIYRASKRGASTQVRDRVQAVARQLAAGGPQGEPGKAKLMQTRKEVETAWRAVSGMLHTQGEPALAAQVNRFVKEMPAVKTENERVAESLVARNTGPRVR